jgi:hypothetical protein
MTASDVRHTSTRLLIVRIFELRHDRFNLLTHFRSTAFCSWANVGRAKLMGQPNKGKK